MSHLCPHRYSAGTYLLSAPISLLGYSAGTYLPRHLSPSAGTYLPSTYLGWTCDFADTSTDDGTIAEWAWTFGDGNTSTEQNPTHTYLDVGTYTVTLTVTDDGDATDAATETVSVTASGGITLLATGYKVRGLQKADLTWSGASSVYVDVYRDGASIITTENDSAYTDNINSRGGGSAVYQVCEAGTSTCSNTVTVTF